MKIKPNLLIVICLFSGIGAFFYAMDQRTGYEEALRRNQVHQAELSHNKELLSKTQSLSSKTLQKQLHQEARRDSLRLVLKQCN